MQAQGVPASDDVVAFRLAARRWLEQNFVRRGMSESPGTHVRGIRHTTAATLLTERAKQRKIKIMGPNGFGARRATSAPLGLMDTALPG